MNRRRKIVATFVVCVFSAGLGLLAGHIATMALVLTGSLATGIGLLMRNPQQLAVWPLAINWENATVQITAAIAAGLPLVIFTQVVFGGLRADESGSEHGSARWATPKEALGLADRHAFCNNFWWGDGAGIAHSTKSSARVGFVRRSHERKLARALYNLNHNILVFGESGTGKTRHIGKPDMMQAIGAALCGQRAGGLVGFINHTHLPIIYPMMKRSAEKQSKFLAQVHQGFDVYNIDPKGDMLRDLGGMFEAAGFDIHIFDVGRQIGHFNPFAYLKTHLTDVVSAETLRVHVFVRAHGQRKAERVELIAGTGVRGEGISSHFGGRAKLTVGEGSLALANIQAHLTFEKTVVSGHDLIKEELAKLGDDAEVEATIEKGGGIWDIAHARTYEQTRWTLEIDIENCATQQQAFVVDIELDPAMMAYSEASLTQGLGSLTQEHTPGFEGEKFCWVTHPISPHIPERASTAQLSLSGHIHVMEVPDAIQLAKVVHCIAVNLGENKNVSGDSIFWEQTKELKLMCYSALCFEQFGKESGHCNLGQVMRYLAMENIDDKHPDAQSEFDLLIEQWETGKKRVRGKERYLRGSDIQEAWAQVDVPHSRSASLAVHCHRAISTGAAETKQSVLISCHAAFVRLVPPAIREMLATDDLALDKLGTGNGKHAVFAMPQAHDNTYSFLFALITFLAMNLMCEAAVSTYSGRMPRHTRFLLDEAGTTGRVLALETIINIIRSLNGSISMYLQSEPQLALLYGENEGRTIRDGCSTHIYLGTQSEQTLERLEKLLGSRTVYGKTASRQDGGGGSESVQASSKPLDNAATMRMSKKEDVRILTLYRKPIKTQKFKTDCHPLYAYIDPTSKRRWTQPRSVFSSTFDHKAYYERRVLRQFYEVDMVALEERNDAMRAYDALARREHMGAGREGGG